MDATCLKTFGLAGDNVIVTFIPQDGSGAQTIDGIVQNPNQYEDAMPGGTKGTTVVHLFVQYSTLTPAPSKGDVISINGKNYFIQNPDVDLAGGAILKLRLS